MEQHDIEKQRDVDDEDGWKTMARVRGMRTMRLSMRMMRMMIMRMMRMTKTMERRRKGGGGGGRTALWQGGREDGEGGPVELLRLRW